MKGFFFLSLNWLDSPRAAAVQQYCRQTPVGGVRIDKQNNINNKQPNKPKLEQAGDGGPSMVTRIEFELV